MYKITPNNLFIHANEIFIKKILSHFLSDKQFIVYDYLSVFKKFPNLKNPDTFSEKIQWIKLYGGIDKYSKYVDKYEAREFISKTMGNKHLIRLYGVWDNFNEIDFNKLPNQFVLKATHGSAYNFICKDKSLLDINNLRKTVTNWLREDFYSKTREIQYKNCRPRIICEKYMADKHGDLPEFKVFCFNGKPHMIEVISNMFSPQKGDDYMDLKWNKLKISSKESPNSNIVVPKPNNLESILDIASKLSKNFPFVRVDLYSVNNKIYFGELTFTPASGLTSFNPPEVDHQLGELIDLSKYRASLSPNK